MNSETEDQTSEPDADVSILDQQQILENKVSELNNILTEVIINNDIMSKKCNHLNSENERLYKKIENMHIELTELNQYGRRQSIEIVNIDESIRQTKLEDYVINFFASLKIEIESYNIVAVHRLGKFSGKNRNVIVRFLNRKDAISILKKRRQILNLNGKNRKFNKLFVIENLCPYNKKIFNKLYNMKKSKEINSVWSYNGKVFMRINKDGETLFIQQLSDIDYFMEEDFLYSSYIDTSENDNSFTVNVAEVTPNTENTLQVEVNADIAPIPRENADDSGNSTSDSGSN